MSQELVDLFSAAIGGLFSLVFEFFPVVKDWYAALEKGQKQMVIGAIALVLSVASFGLSCAGIWSKIFAQIVIPCDFNGALMMVQVLVAVVGGAQFTHLVVKFSAFVRETIKR